MDSSGNLTHLWLKYKIVTRDGEIIYNEMKIPLNVYRRIARNVKLSCLDSMRNTNITKEIYLELIAYTTDLEQIFLK